MSECTIDGCAKRLRCKGLCESHYGKLRYHGDPLWTRPTHVSSPCKIEKCEKPSTSLGMCDMHYMRHYTHGDPNVVLPPGGVVRKPRPTCTVEDCDKPNNAKSRCQLHYVQWRRANGLVRKQTATHCAKGHALTPDNLYESGIERRCRQCALSKSARRRADYAEGDHIYLDELWLRDDGICGICREYVDPTLRKPDMASASLGHITALSRGGTHTWGNAQLAHLDCNIRKGNRELAAAA